MGAEQRARIEVLADSMDWRGYDPEMGTAIRALLAAYDAAVARIAELEGEEAGRIMLAAYDEVVAEERASGGR